MTRTPNPFSRTLLRAGLLLALLLASAAAQPAADFDFSANADDPETVVLRKYRGAATDVEVPGTFDGRRVAAIGREAFAENRRMTRVSIPSGVRHVESQAFAYCSGLEHVEMGPDVETIDAWAFRGCPRLAAFEVSPDNAWFSSDGGVLFDKDRARLIQYPSSKAGAYAIPGGVERIADNAFSRCGRLAAVEIPPGVRHIGDWAFERCTALAEVVLPPNLLSLGQGAFSGCGNLVALTIGEGLQRIENRTFESCGFAAVALPESLVHVGQWAFYGCKNLLEIALPPGVERIEQRTFFNCRSLAKATLCGNVGYVGEWAFAECPKLAGVYLLGDAPETEPDAFHGSPAVVVYRPARSAGWASLLADRPVRTWTPPPELGRANVGFAPGSDAVGLIREMPAAAPER
jgi:hypothetical protein